MPSPDATPYVDLTLYDKDPVEVFESGLVNLRQYLPDWTPRRGHTEVLLLESLALEVSELIFAANRVPGAVLEVLLRLYGVQRSLGTPPVATIRFTAVDTNGYTIPAGIRVGFAVPGGLEPIIFATNLPVAIPPGQLSIGVPVTGNRNTDEANGLPAGSPVELLDAVSPIERVDLISPISGGSDPEDDDAWFTRGIQRFARLVETLVLPRHFVSAALEQPQVSRAFAIDNYNPDAGSGAPGSHGGHITVAVYGLGDFVSDADRTTLQNTFDASAQANLAIHVVNPTITNVDVTATVVPTLGFPTNAVQANVIAALSAYLSPATWNWGATVYRNELIALLDRVDGVERVTSLTTPSADQTLAGVAPLARLGTANITVSA